MKIARQHAPVTLSEEFEDGVTYSFTPDAVMFEAVTSRTYTKPQHAVVRELCSNAWDEHVKHDVSRPFLVVAPSQLEPMLTIRDFAKGLPHDLMVTLMTVFGASLNRMMGNTNGGFGWGAKCPFSVTDQFTITNRHEGKGRIYSAFKQDGLPKLTFSDEFDLEPDDPTGLEFRIPCRETDFRTWRTAIQDSLQWFPQGAYELVGAQVEPVGFMHETDRWNLFDTTRDSMLLMGTVAYRIDFSALNVRPIQGVLFKLPIGAVSPQVSREALYYDDNTKAVMTEAVEVFKAELNAYVAKVIDDPVPWKRGLRFKALRNQFGSLMNDVDFTSVISDIEGVMYDVRTNRRGRIPTNFSSHAVQRVDPSNDIVVMKRDADRIGSRLLNHYQQFARKRVLVMDDPSTITDEFVLASDYEPRARERYLKPKRERAVLYVFERVSFWDKRKSDWIQVSEPDGAKVFWLPLTGTACKIADYRNIVSHPFLERARVFGLTKRAQDEWAIDDNYEWIRADEYVAARQKELEKDKDFLRVVALQAQETDALCSFLHYYGVHLRGVSRRLDTLIGLVAERNSKDTAGFDKSNVRLPKVPDLQQLSDQLKKRYPILDLTSRVSHRWQDEDFEILKGAL